MLNFRAVGFIDIFDLVPSVRARLALFKADADAFARRRTLPLRWQDGEVWKRSKEWNRWAELRNTLDRIQRAGEQIVGKVERGRIFLEMLDPGTMTPWHVEEDQNWLRLYLPIRTNPAVIIYRGIEATHLPAGNLTLVGMARAASSINGGDCPAITLIADFRPVAKMEEPT